MRSITFLVVLVAVIGLSACSQAIRDDGTVLKQPKYDELLKSISGQNGRLCIRERDINGYGTLNSHVLSVASRKNKHYLVTTMYSCPSLQHSMRAAFIGSFSDFCGGRDKIATDEESCPIRNIYEFDSRDAAFEAFDQAKEKYQAVEQEIKEIRRKKS